MTSRLRVTAAVSFGMAVWAVAGRAAPLQRVVDDGDRVVLAGNVHPWARSEFDAGRTDGSVPEERMILALALAPEKRAALERLLVEQQDPGSPNFHRWLTPDEFGAHFGATPDEIALVTGWLQSHGFAVDEVGRGGTWINFTGTVADVEAAFRTQIHDYVVAGDVHHANAADPSIPRALADLVVGVVSLHDFRPEPASHLSLPGTNLASGEHWLSPGDLATIYNVNPLYSAGINGSGQSIAVIARTNLNLSDVQYFRSLFNLPSNDPQFIINGTDPGIISSSEESEADLDVEWSGAVAPNATIKVVITKSTNATSGEILSAQYIVNNNVAPVTTMSFYLCESSLGTSWNQFYNTMWSQAAAQGISVFVCSGDSGAAGCDSDSAASATHGLGVNGSCTTPYSVCVGGTQFMDTANPSQYWSASNNSTTLASALSYIPEQAWNESGAAANCLSDDTCQQLWSTGGGASTVYAKPAWQVAPGVPSDGARDVPDVSLASATHNSYIIIKDHVQGSNTFSGSGGTSASTPAFAGLMALIVQKTGQRQGNPNPRLYQLGAAQYGGSGPAVFHDVTVGNNTVPGQAGFSCATGYDQATGLGSVDATALANNWASSGGGTVTIFSDNFAGSFPGQWHLSFSSRSGTDTNISWGKSTYRTTGSSASIWCAGGGSEAQPPGGTYLPNMGTFAIYGPFSLAGATAATLDFDLWLNSETNYDFMNWVISVDGSHFYGYQTSGNTGGWTHKTLNFADVTQIAAVGASNVWVALLFTSDSSNQYEGAYVGNVVIAKTTPAVSCSYSLSSSSQSFPSAGGTGSVGVTVLSGSGCSWSATSNASGWLHVTSGASGTGNGTVGYSVDANSGSARAGTLTVAGQTFTVNQSGGTVSYAYSYWLPVISHASGAGGTAWRSDVGALNRSGSTASVEFVLYTGSATAAATSTIPGSGQAVFIDLAAQLGVTSGSGALKVLSTQPLLVTSRTYNLQPSGWTYGQGYDGIASTDALQAGGTAWLPQLAQSGVAGQAGTSRVNIGITNTGSAAASVTLTLYDGNGTQVWTDTRTYAAGQFYQYQEPYRTGAGRTDIAAGYATITVNSGSGIIAYASDIDNGSGDPTTVNMKQ